MTAVTVLFMGIALAGALVAVGVKSILHAVFGLAIALVGVSGLFVVLHSPLLAVMEILIYVGGISVAMIFAVMLSRVISTRKSEPNGRKLLAGLAALVFFGGMAVVISRANLGSTEVPANRDTNAKQIGLSLLNEYNVVFETLSLVLLLAIIGAIVIARKPTRIGAPDGGEPEAVAVAAAAPAPEIDDNEEDEEEQA